jgi:hypothetical protein
MKHKDKKRIETCALKARVVVREIAQRSRHFRVVIEGNRIGVIFVSITPSDNQSADRNVITDMRKAGYV